MLQREVFVGEFCTVNRFATSTITSCEIPSLTHEIWNHSVESTAFEMQGLARFSSALLTRAQGTKVFRGLWCHICPELHDNSTCGGTTDGHVKENFRIAHGTCKTELVCKDL